MLSTKMELCSLSHEAQSINTNILNELLFIAPNSESGIKKPPRPNAFRHLSDGAYQVKVHRALMQLKEASAIEIVKEERTHGGLLSKTYAITGIGLITLLGGRASNDVFRNIGILTQNLRLAMNANPKLLPFVFGLAKAIEDPHDFGTFKAIMGHFFNDTLLQRLILSNRLGFFGLMTPDIANYLDRSFILYLANLHTRKYIQGRPLPKGSTPFEMLLALLRRSEETHPYARILTEEFKSACARERDDLRQKEHNLSLLEKAFPTPA